MAWGECEGCRNMGHPGVPATTMDEGGTKLCDACWDELMAEPLVEDPWFAEPDVPQTSTNRPPENS